MLQELKTGKYIDWIRRAVISGLSFNIVTLAKNTR
jgi:hypothetical protein